MLIRGGYVDVTSDFIGKHKPCSKFWLNYIHCSLDGEKAPCDIGADGKCKPRKGPKDDEDDLKRDLMDLEKRK